MRQDRLRSRSLLFVALAMCSTAALAADVYQWKDANGVTHYSQTPPPQGSSSYRMFLYGKREAAKGKESPATQQCTTARSNVALLESGAPLRRDTDGDGKPDQDLNPSDRAQQLELARMVLKANCGGSTAKAGKP